MLTNYTQNLKIKLISVDSPDYQEELMLRDEILRQPIGLSLFDEPLSEADDIHIGAYHSGILIGCLVLTPLSLKNELNEAVSDAFDFPSERSKRGYGTPLSLKNELNEAVSDAFDFPSERSKRGYGTPLSLKDELNEAVSDAFDFPSERSKRGYSTPLSLKNELNEAVTNKLNAVKMRQVAVREEMQHRGVGRRLVEFAEDIARNEGFSCMVMHARQTAVPFYERLNYSAVGAGFLEKGIPHIEMYKNLKEATS